jgi:hypothetical protein
MNALRRLEYVDTLTRLSDQFEIFDSAGAALAAAA